MKILSIATLLFHFNLAFADVIVVCPKQTAMPDLEVSQTDDQISVKVRGALALEFGFDPDSFVHTRRAEYDIEFASRDCILSKVSIRCHARDAQIRSKRFLPYVTWDKKVIGSFQLSVFHVSYGTQVDMSLHQTEQAGHFYVNNGGRACVFEI